MTAGGSGAVLTVRSRGRDSDILVMPKPHIRKKNARKPGEKFFILTSEDAYAAKLKQREKKRRRLKWKRNSAKKNERN